MPAKLWSQDNQGQYFSRVVTNWDRPLGGEEYRADAEDLDERLDAVLDDAISRIASTQAKGVNRRFVRIWCVGRSVSESKIVELPALRTERRVLLWRAMAWKCWLGTRHDFPNSDLEAQWAQLRPGKQAEPKNPFRVHDLFETGYWLQQQEFEDAVLTFGGSVSNAVAIGRRTNINALSVRVALLCWISELPFDLRRQLYSPNIFDEIAKALRRRWPDRGFGAAERPANLPSLELRNEVTRVLAPILKQLRDGT